MTKHLHALLLGLVAAAGLAVATGTASANGLSISDTDWNIEWRAVRFEAAGNTITCPIELEGTLHNAEFSKESEQLIGHVTNAVINGECTGGTMTVLTEDLPWHVRFGSWQGELPFIEAVSLAIVGLSLQVRTGGGITCLFGTEAAEPFIGIAAVEFSAGELLSVSIDETTEIDLDGEFLCELAGDATFAGTASVEDGASEELFLTLAEIDPPAGRLSSTPSSVAIEEMEEAGRFTVRNIGGSTVTVDRTSLTGVDTERPEFEVSAPGCESRFAVERSCVYTVVVSDRPLREASIVLEYDDGQSGSGRLTVPVEIRGEDPALEARLSATPSSVSIEALEQSDTVAVRNTGGGATATIERVVVTTTDTESPEFSVTSGCRSTVAKEEACSYLITVNTRPETSGRITIYYDDGVNEADQTLVIGVDVAEEPRPAELLAEPDDVVIERLESNDSFVLRNVGAGSATALIDRSPVVQSSDRESPDFAVTGPGCSLIMVDGASCTYIITVNSRPETSGTITFYYDDGVGGERTEVIDVDIAS